MKVEDIGQQELFHSRPQIPPQMDGDEYNPTKNGNELSNTPSVQQALKQICTPSTIHLFWYHFIKDLLMICIFMNLSVSTRTIWKDYSNEI